MKKEIIFLIYMSVIIAAQGQYNDTLKINYFNQEPPGNTPKLFAPDIISKPGVHVQNSCFSSNGKEFIYVKTDGSWSKSYLMYSKYSNSGWSEPVEIPEGRGSVSPYFTRHDSDIYFAAHNTRNDNADIFVIHRNNNGWSLPDTLPVEISSSKHEFEVCLPKENIMYFTSTRDGTEDLFRAELNGNKVTKVEKLGPTINTSSKDECPFVAPDESYIVFNDWKYNSKFAGNNIYISFKKEDGSWKTAFDLGNKVNTNELDIYPYISPDCKYLFFTRRQDKFPAAFSSIYWVNLSSIIDSTKQLTTVKNSGISKAHFVYNEELRQLQLIDKEYNNQDKKICIYSTSGRCLYAKWLEKNNFSIHVPQVITPGIYIVHISSDSKNFSGKIVIK